MTISLNTNNYSQPLMVSRADNRQDVANLRPNPTSTNTSLVDKVSLSSELQMGEDMVLGLGRVALGGNEQLKKWSEKGLDVSEDSLRLAFESLNQAMKEHVRNPDSIGVAINRYQIVENSQAVPAWFKAEKADNLSMISDPAIKAAFQAGDLYHLNVETAGINAKALSAYKSVGGI
ncbi:MAG: hypothetical protein ACU83U_12035 [Gammaproteobacteria bacterium]